MAFETFITETFHDCLNSGRQVYKSGCAKRKEQDKREFQAKRGERTFIDVGWPSKEKKQASQGKQTQIDKKDSQNLDFEKVSPPGVEELTHVNGDEAAQLMHQPNEAYSSMECTDLIEKSKNYEVIPSSNEAEKTLNVEFDIKTGYDKNNMALLMKNQLSEEEVNALLRYYPNDSNKFDFPKDADGKVKIFQAAKYHFFIS